MKSKSNQKYENKFREGCKPPWKTFDIHSSSKYLSADSVLGTVLVARGTAVMELTFRRGEVT